MSHHPNGIDIAIVLPHGRDHIHHFVRYLVSALGPSVDHFIVFLTLGNQAVLVLLLIFLDKIASLIDKDFLAFRHDHVVLAERNSCQTRMTKAQFHKLIGKNHCILLTAMTIDLINDLANLFLGKQPVDQIKWYVGVMGKNIRNHHPASSGFHQPSHRLAILVHGVVTCPDLRMQGNCPCFQGQLNLSHIGESHSFAGATCDLRCQKINAQNDIL